MVGTKNGAYQGKGFICETDMTPAQQVMTANSDFNGFINVNGDPEGVETANPGTLGLDRTGNLYLKESGTGNTGWAQVSSTDLRTARYIVSPGGAADGANYTTIGSAYAAAVADGAPQTVFIQPGTYPEDLTLSPQINLCAYVSDSMDEVVTIVGKISYSSTGNCALSGIHFETNGDFLLEVTGSNTGMLSFRSCRFVGADNTAISVNAANQSCRFVDCFFTTESSNILFEVTTSNGIDIRNSEIRTADGTSTVAARGINFFNSKVQGFTLTTSGTGLISAYNTWFFNGGLNATIFTCGGSGVHSIHNSYLQSGTATALVVNDNLTLSNVSISSSNASVISGTGNLSWSKLGFTGSSRAITTTTKTPLDPIAFLAYNSVTDTNVTGDGTIYTCIFDTENFDIGSNYDNTTGIFTAPVDGIYTFTAKILVQGGTDISALQLWIVTTNETFKTNNASTPQTASTTTANRMLTVTCELSATDTVRVQIQGTDSGGIVDDLFGSATSTQRWTYFCGNLVAQI